MPQPAVASNDPLALTDEVLGAVTECKADIQKTKRAVGRVNTPAHVARWMAREAVKVLARLHTTPTIVEPAAGSGVIIAALVEAMGRRRAALRSVWAIDKDPAVKIAAGHRLRLSLGTTAEPWLRRQYRVGDALLDSSLVPNKPIDLIIGNPPYLGVRHAKRLPNYETWKNRFGVSEDLYAFFIRWAMKTVRPGGHVLLLVPDGWLTQSSYEDLRCELLQGRLQTVVRLPAGTFDCHVLPSFFLWRKTRPRSNVVRYIDARAQHSESRNAVYKLKQSAFAAAPGRIIFMPTPKAKALSRTLSLAKGLARPLSDVAGITDVGIHSRNCRHRLFYARRTKTGLHRLLQGRQIEPYVLRWNSPKAQYRWVDIHYEPKADRRGRRGNGQLSVRPEYWDWQGDPAIHRLPERILIRQTGDRIVAARCLQNHNHHYTDNTLFTAVLTESARSAGITYPYLLAYLNAAIVSDLYRFLSGEQGRAQAQIKISLLRRLPFVLPTPRSVARIGSIVHRIERAANGPSVKKEQTKIDRHFARLFVAATNGMLAQSPGPTCPGF
ncbi:MAG: N-6 DNA methylase [Phycisphaerales bacterium]|nr:N-6 DNA methylase [Phycisphaerales bacterium]